MASPGFHSIIEAINRVNGQLISLRNDALRLSDACAISRSQLAARIDAILDGTDGPADNNMAVTLSDEVEIVDVRSGATHKIARVNLVFKPILTSENDLNGMRAELLAAKTVCKSIVELATKCGGSELMPSGAVAFLDYSIRKDRAEIEKLRLQVTGLEGRIAQEAVADADVTHGDAHPDLRMVIRGDVLGYCKLWLKRLPEGNNTDAGQWVMGIREALEVVIANFDK